LITYHADEKNLLRYILYIYIYIYIKQ